MKNLLCLNDVCLNYHTEAGETLALQDLSFCLGEDEFLSIVGPSGCGKTTVLSLISGLMKPSSGEILFDDGTKGHAKIGYMLQRDHLFEWRTIWQNVILGLEIQKLKTAQHLDYAKNLLEKYGLKDFAQSYPRQLSGGMRQRVALIRTLATDPDILLLDEPFSALDYQTRLNITDDVHGIIKNEHKSTVLVTHDISEAISLSDRIVVLSARPATVKVTYPISLEGTPLQRRENKEFGKWFDTIWKEFSDENTAH